MTSKKLFNLSKKVIVITGAAGFLGQIYSDAIIKQGGFPIMLDINYNSLKQFKNKNIDKCDIFKCDITNEKNVKKISKEIIRKYKNIDALINNAANNPKVESKKQKNFTRLEDFSLEEWNKDIAVNLTGSFLTTKYFGSLISKNKKGGVIINISSDLSLIAPDQRIYSKKSDDPINQIVKPITYSVTKSGINGLTRYTSTYWNKENVRCNALCIGGIENKHDQEFLKKVSERIPMGRLAKPNEYIGTLIWMLSDSSTYLNGSFVVVDGGRTAW